VINLTDVIAIHQVLVDKFGGSSGIRDHKALESAIARPFATFEKKDLYPSVIENRQQS
jgi:death-on-curing protein